MNKRRSVIRFTKIFIIELEVFLGHSFFNNDLDKIFTSLTPCLFNLLNRFQCLNQFTILVLHLGPSDTRTSIRFNEE